MRGTSNAGAACAPFRSNVRLLFSFPRLAGLACFLLMVSPTAAWAQNPFTIDGNLIPDDGATQFPDPFGSVQELGPVNGNTTKIGVVHTAATPMLSFTNPNGQTDLVQIWLATAEALDGDTWLYIAWERDSFSGSSVITYEFQAAALPADCDYTGDVDWVEPVSSDEADLIANCNPWSLRAENDFLIGWDFKGGATDIVLRTFDGMAFDAGVTLDAAVAVAALNGSTSKGEAAVNLTETIFDSEVCTSVGYVIPGTVTGNSDSADYKDTVFAPIADQLTISNCGVVKIRKETDPDGESGSFDFTHNLAFLPASAENSFSLSDDGLKMYGNVVAPDTPYYVDETDPSPNFTLTDIDCTASDSTVNITSTSLMDGRVTFDLDRGETLDCTFTNSLNPQVTLVKSVAVGSALPNDFSLTQDGVGVTSGQAVTYDIGDTVTLDETQVSGYEFVSLTGHAKCPSALGGSTSALAAGDDITCTITNTLRPKVTLVKSLQTGSDSLNSFGLTQDGVGVTSGQTVTHFVDDEVTINESGLAGYEFVEITGTGCPSSPGGSVGPLVAGDDITCTIVNTLKPKVTLVKSLQTGGASLNSFGLTQDGAGVDSGETVTYDVGDEVTINEAGLAGYEFVEITGTGCPGSLGGTVGPLVGGDDITCTIVNTLKPKVTLNKLVSEGDALPNDFSLTQNGVGVTSGQTVTYDVGASVTLDETQLPGYGFVSLGGDAGCPASLGGTVGPLAGGDDITCTITNTLQEGAIRITKTRKYAAAVDDAEYDGDATDEPHPGVTFTISGGSLDSPVDVVTNADGEACLDNLAFSVVDGDYTVTETVPSGYESDDEEQTVSIDQVGTCAGGNEEMVSFHNTPLTDVTVSVAAQDPDATRSRINCYEATLEMGVITLGTPLAENTTFEDDVEEVLEDLPPDYPNGFIVCTIEIDP